MWESVPKQLSGKIYFWLLDSWIIIPGDKYSKFTWCTIPTPGGIIEKFENADCPHLSNWYLSLFLLNSSLVFLANAPSEAK